MNKIMMLCLTVTLVLVFSTGCKGSEKAPNGAGVLVEENSTKYIMPDEADEHEGTWLQWPHENIFIYH